MIPLILLALCQSLAPVHAAECDPKIAEGAAAFNEAESIKRFEEEWDQLSYFNLNHMNRGVEIIPIRLGQLVTTLDGVAGAVQRIDNLRNIAVLDRRTDDNRYVEVDLQSIHPRGHGAKPLKVGSKVLLIVEGKIERALVKSISPDRTNAVIRLRSEDHTVLLRGLFREITGTRRVFFDSHIPTLTGRNSILDHQGMGSWLNFKAFKALEGIHNLRDQLRLYGIATTSHLNANTGLFELKLDLEASDPENILVKFVIHANHMRDLMGFKRLEVHFAKTDSFTEFQIENKITKEIIEHFELKDDEVFVEPKYFDPKIHEIHKWTNNTHAAYSPSREVVTLSHKNLIYILSEGSLGYSIYHEFGHGYSFAFENSPDTIGVDSEDPFYPKYHKFFLDENRQRLQDFRKRLSAEMKRGEVSFETIYDLSLVLSSIRKTASLSEALVREVLDTKLSQSPLNTATLTLSGSRSKLNLALHSSDIRVSLTIAGLKELKPKAVSDFIESLPEAEKMNFNKNKMPFLVSPHTQSRLLNVDMRSTAKKKKIQDYIEKHNRVAQQTMRDLEELLIELDGLYTPMIHPALELEHRIKGLSERYEAMTEDQRIDFVKQQLEPGVSSIWDQFKRHRDSQVDRRKRQKGMNPDQRSTSPEH